MTDTQKKCVKKWASILLIIAISAITLAGITCNQNWAFAIVMIAFVAMVGFIIVSWVCYAINEWRIMGVLTPEEYQIYIQYKLFSKGQHPGIYANKCSNPKVKRVYLKAATAKRITFFDDYLTK